MTTSYYFWEHQRVGLLRGREKMVYWCMPLFLPHFLSSFYHFLFFSLRSFFTLSFLLLSCRRLFPFFGLSFSWVPFSGCLLLSYHRFSPLKCFPPLGLPLLVFFSLPLFFPPPFSPPSRAVFHPWLPLSFIMS